MRSGSAVSMLLPRPDDELVHSRRPPDQIGLTTKSVWTTWEISKARNNLWRALLPVPAVSTDSRFFPISSIRLCSSRAHLHSHSHSILPRASAKLPFHVRCFLDYFAASISFLPLFDAGRPSCMAARAPGMWTWAGKRTIFFECLPSNDQQCQAGQDMD